MIVTYEFFCMKKIFGLILILTLSHIVTFASLLYFLYKLQYALWQADQVALSSLSILSSGIVAFLFTYFIAFLSIKRLYGQNVVAQYSFFITYFLLTVLEVFLMGGSSVPLFALPSITYSFFLVDDSPRILNQFFSGQWFASPLEIGLKGWLLHLLIPTLGILQIFFRSRK